MRAQLYEYGSPVLRLLEGVAVVGTIALHLRDPLTNASWGTWLPHALLIAGYVLLRICGTVRWYPRAARPAGVAAPGIEWQFRHGVVVGVYGLLAAALCRALSAPSHLLWPCLLPVGIFVGAQAVLLYCHVHDNDPRPVNCYSARARHFDAVAAATVSAPARRTAS